MSGNIHTWFPKSIYDVKNILLDRLTTYELAIKNIITEHNSKRDSTLAVDSTHLTNDKLHENIVFKELVDEIYTNTQAYARALGYSDSLIESLHVNNMWANISHKNDFIFPHVHPGAIFSGAYYIKKYTNSKIRFHNNIHRVMPPPLIYNELNYELCEYDCDPGRMLIWMSDFCIAQENNPKEKKLLSPLIYQ
jgi:uncharacterized protein (TIGR02466 family)